MEWILGAKDVGLESRHYDAVMAALKSIGGREVIRAAFVSGSLSVGAGSPTSDIDVLVVMAAGAPLTVVNLEFCGYEVDLDPIGVGEFERLVATATRYEASMASRWQIDLPQRDVRRLTRIAMGNELWVDSIIEKECRRISRSALTQLAIIRLCQSAACLLEDVYGAMSMEDYVSALAGSERAVIVACHACLAASGQLLSSRKALFRMLARGDAVWDLADEVWDLLSWPSRSATLEELDCLIANRLQFANDLLVACVMGLWCGAGEPRQLRRTRCGDLVRNPYYVLMRFTDGYALRGPNCGFEISEELACLWALLDGSDLVALEQAWKGRGSAVANDHNFVVCAIKNMLECGVAEVRADGGRAVAKAADCSKAAGSLSTAALLKRSQRFYLGRWCVGTAN